MPRLGIITGLASESRCLDPWRGNPEIEIACAAADPERAASLAEAMVANGCRGLVSFGIAGGLEKSVATGDLVLPEQIVGDGQAWACSEEWCRALRKELAEGPVPHSGILAGSAQAVASAADKAELRRTMGAIATDMESLSIAEVAARHQLPFLAVRAVADPWDQDVPVWMPALIDEQGRVRMARAMASVLTHPRNWREVKRLRRQSRRAHETLGRVATLAGPFFGFTELGR